MKIVFMGTSEFAIPTLEKLHNSHHKIISIVTQPSKPKGRGQILSHPPVKKKAIELGYKVMQPYTVNDTDFIASIKILNPDAFVVLSFGQILCTELLKIPEKGAINVHPSLIPRYRGAAPIQWAIINRETKTGVTTILMDSGMDTGSVLLSKSTNIKPSETSSCLHKRLSKMGSNLLIQTIEKMQNNSLKPMPQDCKSATKAPILKKENGLINWNRPAIEIESFIRGMNPWPGAFTFYKGYRLKIISADVLKSIFSEPPGTILPSDKKNLYISTSQNVIVIKCIQGPSGKKLPITAFLCGFQFSKGNMLDSYQRDINNA